MRTSSSTIAERPCCRVGHLRPWPDDRHMRT